MTFKILTEKEKTWKAVGRAEALKEVEEIINNTAIVTKAISRALRDKSLERNGILNHYRVLIKERIAGLNNKAN